MQNNSTSIRRVMGLAAMLAVMAGTAIANAQSAQSEFKQPLKKQGSSTGSRTVINEVDGDDKYMVRIEGDTITAEVNGEEVPQERIRRRAGRIEILDENKDVIKSFNISTYGAGGFGGGISPRFQIESLQPGGQGGAWMVQPDMQPPKAMMGITLSDAEDGEGASIDSVMEDMPAQKAGVKTGDVVVEANGKKVTNQQELRDIIREADPGDTLNLKVRRDGNDVNLKVKLTKWDQEKIGGGVGQFYGPMTGFGGHGQHFEGARKSLEKALATIKENERLTGSARETVQKALQDALAALDEAKTQGPLMLDFDHDEHTRLFGPGGRAFRVPGTPAAPDGDVSRQLERLNNQLERLNKRMEELEKNRR